MNQLTAFNFENSEVRTVMIDGEPWFITKDVCKVLGHSNNAAAIRSLSDNQKGVTDCYTLGGMQSLSIISEPGLYKLIFRSQMPNAERFTDWVAEEVLPSIRKTGAYSVKPLTKLEALEMAIESEKRFLESEEKRLLLEAKVVEDAPKVGFHDSFANADGLHPVSDLAKMLCAAGIEVGRNRLYDWMRAQKIIMVDSTEPTQPMMDAGYFRRVPQTYEKPDGKKGSTYTTKVTGKGITYIARRWTEFHGLSKPLL